MKFIGISIFLCFLLTAPSIGQSSLSIIGEVSDSYGPLEGSLIKVKKDTIKTANYRTNKKGEFYFELEFGNKFLVSFSKEGYSTKQIIINTELPERKPSDLQQLITLELELIEKLKNIEKEPEPLGTVSFSRITKEFSYKSKFDKNKFTNIEVSGTDYYLAERRNIGMPRKKVKDIKEKIQYDEVDINERKQLFFEEILDKRSELMADKNSYDGTGDEQKRLVTEMPLDTAISFYSAFNMDITEIVLNNDKILRVYHRVKHDWGGVFYFKNYRAISKTLFYLETEIKKEQLERNTSLHSAYNTE